MDRSHINKKAEESLDSLNNAQRAEPAPYLLTRINARMAKEGEPNFWSRAGVFLSRPMVAGFGLVLLIAANLFAVNSFDKKSIVKSATSATSNTSRYDFAINVTSIYDIENPEP